MKFDISKHIAELKQEQGISHSLLNKILYSKRLLADHVESLEQCICHLDDGACEKSMEIFTARNTCIVLGSTVLEHLITPRLLRFVLIPSVVLAGGFSALYLVKNIFIFRNKVVEQDFDNLIKSIDEFGNCVRRNMTYFNEILAMKTSELIESRQIERAWDCITSVKEVVEVLFDATRKLEALYPIPDKFSEFYSPMEELKECDYFRNNITDYNPKNIKDFYNIFAYVQSQFLLRLALTVLQKPSLSALSHDLSSVEYQLRQLVNEEDNHFKNLTIDLRRKKQIGANDFHHTKAQRTRSGPVPLLQDSSLKLSSCMIAVADECILLDEALQRLTETEAVQKDESKDLIDVANSMRSIESSLSACCDDFHRLMLHYNKFLSSKLDNNMIAGEKPVESDDAATDGNESFLRVEISHDNATNDGEKRDDFFAYMFDDDEPLEVDDNRGMCADREILNFEKRMTKSKFKPVLKQLKHRIDPIRQEMLEKERRVLQSKGINVDELFANEDNEQSEGHNSDEESGGSADEMEKRSKKLKERDNFAEMRNFLAQKQAVNLFEFGLPQHSTPVNEEILE